MPLTQFFFLIKNVCQVINTKKVINTHNGKKETRNSCIASLFFEETRPVCLEELPVV